jgi:hypothetical protein
MSAYSQLQEEEFRSELEQGYEAVKHQRFVGTGYFDAVTQVIAGGASSVTALAGSTEAAQFAPTKLQGHSKNATGAVSQLMHGDGRLISTVELQIAEPGPEESLMPSGD